MKFDLGKRLRHGLIERTLSSCTRWAEHRVCMPNPFPGPVDFNRFPWQKEIINIEEGEVTVKKAAQIGFSVAGLVRALYTVGERGLDVLYVLPTAGLAGDFSKARLDGITSLSPELKDLFSVSDSVGLKTTASRSNLYIRGSVSSRSLVSVPVSCAIIDEYDRCADGTYDLVSERLSGQLSKYLFSLSTPTLPEFGIDALHRKGTQEVFHFPCPSCSRLETLRWPDNVEIVGEHPGDPRCAESYYKCSLCGAKLPHEDKMAWLSGAQWVPSVKVSGHRSFSINQMFSTTVSPGEMVRAYLKSQYSEHAATEWKNQKLGEPHLAEGARLTDKLIEDRKSDYLLGADRPENATRLIVMGVDVGTFLDCVVMEFILEGDPRNEPYEHSMGKVLQAVRIPAEDWRQLDNMMREWQIHKAVVDFQPDTVNARAFCRRFGAYAEMCQYRRGTTGNEIKETEDERGVRTLTVDRTSFMDMSLGRYHKGKVQIPRNIPGWFCEHLKAPMRTYELDELGLPRGVYKSIADDHFAHAITYAEIAFQRAYCMNTGRTIKPGETP